MDSKECTADALYPNLIGTYFGSSAIKVGDWHQKEKGINTEWSKNPNTCFFNFLGVENIFWVLYIEKR